MGDTKMMKKSKLTFNDGLFFTKKGRIVAIDPVVVSQFNDLERMVQMYDYIEDQPKAQPEPSLDGFEFKSTLSTQIFIEATTEMLDKKYEEATQIMAELDAKANAHACNEIFKRYEALTTWVDNDEILVTVNPSKIPDKIDTFYLGNPLNADLKQISDAIVHIGTDGKARRDYD